MDNNNLDYLLDDLQSSVGRPAALNGPSGASGMASTGYREVSRTVTTAATGQLPSTTREYQIEYLSPANSTTVPEERAASPSKLLMQSSLGGSLGGPGGALDLASGMDSRGNMSSSYKTMSYEYKTSTGASSNTALLQDAASTMSTARAVTDGNQHNLSELDTLLDDLNAAQRAGFTREREYQVTTTSSGRDARDGYDLEPMPAPPTRAAQHVSRSTQRTERTEHRYGSLNRDRQSPSPARIPAPASSSLDRGTSPRLGPKSSSITSRDVTYTSSRTTSPSPIRRETPPSPAGSRQVVHHEVYRYETKGNGGANSTTTTTRYRDVSPPRDRVRAPSPGQGPPPLLPDYPATGAAKVSTLVKEYERRASREEQEAAQLAYIARRSPSPSPAGRKMITTTTTYNYSTNSGGRPGDLPRTPPRTPPPHRSPSPVSFPMHPETHTGYSSSTYRRDETYNSSRAHRSPSPQPAPFPTTRVHTYQMTHKEPPLQPRPFPTPSPSPHEDQRPPKELNELMSSFSETEMTQTNVRRAAHDLEQRSQRTPAAPPAASPAPPTPPPALKDEVATRNVAGPPVYYPPGVEMFQHREESMQQSGGGGYKGKAKAKYEYKMKQRSKESSKTGKAIVPVCLPLCCAMPCEIM